MPNRGLDRPPSREGRPSGETGGHTVQDWEEPPSLRSLSTPLDGESFPSSAAAPPLLDEASPSTVPLYLRSAKAPEVEGPTIAAPEVEGPTTATTTLEARTRILTAQSAAITDAMTRDLAEALAISLRPIVASTVVALLPMILSLGSIPEDEWPEAARPIAETTPVAPRPKSRC